MEGFPKKKHMEGSVRLGKHVEVEVGTLGKINQLKKETVEVGFSWKKIDGRRDRWGETTSFAGVRQKNQ